MKKFLFIISHLGSNSDIFCSILNKNSKILINNTNNTYHHPFDLDELGSTPHKLNNVSAIYADHLLYNYQFSSKILYSCCKFIYFIKNGKNTLINLVKDKNSIPYLINSYAFRLRRMYEMKVLTGGVFVDYNKMSSKNDEISSYLGLNEKLEFIEKDVEKKTNPLINYSQFIEIDKIYEKYYYLLSK